MMDPKRMVRNAQTISRKSSSSPAHIAAWKSRRAEVLTSAASSRLPTVSMLFLGMADIAEGSVVQNIGSSIPHIEKDAE